MQETIFTCLILKPIFLFQLVKDALFSVFTHLCDILKSILL